MAAVFIVAGVAAAACGAARQSGGGPGNGSDSVLRLGYFPNLTHAAALLGVKEGLFRNALGKAGVEFTKFNAGPSAVEALFSNALDATYIGPGPAINAYVKSRGEAVRFISGATEGGAFLVVQDAIRAADDLRGKKVASPQLGNTQDIALRIWLKDQGLRTNLQAGGDVSVVPQENAQTLDTFRSGDIAGAWVPEPWASRLVTEAGGRVLVDERSLWPEGRFPTTLVIVRTQYLKQHPGVVERLLRAHVQATSSLTEEGPAAQSRVNEQLAKDAGKALPAQVAEAAWKNLSFTTDLVPASFQKIARDAETLGLLEDPELAGAFELELAKRVSTDPANTQAAREASGG